MANRNALEEQFRCLGVDIDSQTLDICVELCETYGIEEEEFVEQWMAFTVSFLNGANPSKEYLSQMERKELVKKEKISTPKRTNEVANLVVYNAPNAVPSIDEDDILAAYNKTPKRNLKPRSALHTPETQGRCKEVDSPRTTFSPASFSPAVATPSSKYVSRTNAGNAVCDFGNCKATDWTGNAAYSPRVDLYDKMNHIAASERYMYASLQDIAEVLDDRIMWVSEAICKKFNLPDVEQHTNTTAGTILTAGRIYSRENDRLQANTVMLEGARFPNFGKSISLNLKQVQDFSLFPGQIICANGIVQPTGEMLVKEIHHNATPVQPVLQELKYPVQVVVAAGPFTQADTLAFQPLYDLISYVEQNKPHLLLLCGPFFDWNHPIVGEGKLAETIDSLFEKLVEDIMQPLQGSRTQVVLVACSRDAFHKEVYPTPAYILGKRYPNLRVAPDPCMIDVDSLIIGATSTDVLFDIGKEEISQQMQSSDRLGRLARHIVHQQSFYPLYPPGGKLPLDVVLWEQYALMPVLPHILILPSDLRYFIKEINGCVVVNPEHLAKGVVGGSFARLEINPQNNLPAHEYIVGQIVKI